MNDYETIIGKYFNDLLPLDQCRYSMYNKENIYNRMPQLIYRLSNNKKEQEMYAMIKECIENFEGNLKWTEFQGFLGKKVINHSISPLDFYKMQKESFETNNYVSEEDFFGKEKYQQLCKKAIDDIPALYEHLKKCLPERLRELQS